MNELINKLHDQDMLRIETFGDLEQIRFSSGIEAQLILESIYRET